MLAKQKHQRFSDSKRRHVLIITNHGCHAPVINITNDTGGQNFYVNDLCGSLLKLGYKITILNRGGYNHPVTGTLHKGVFYYDDVWEKDGIYCRVVYLEDGIDEFINKEKLTYDNLRREKDFFFEKFKTLDIDPKELYFILSHYWDGGMLGLFINEELKKRFGFSLPHIWTPHSLGRLKKKNYKGASKDIIKKLNFPFRIKSEEKVIAAADGVVMTSDEIKRTIREYKAPVKNYFYSPPGIDMELFKPRKIRSCKKALRVLKDVLGLKEDEIVSLLSRQVVFMESGRTAKPKQKDMVLKSFAKMKNNKKAALIMTVDSNTKLSKRLYALHEKLNKENNIYLIDKHISDEEISEFYSIADVYVTCSLMEGWGMAVQEAVASKCAVVTSKFVPFINEIVKDDALIAPEHTPDAYAEKMETFVKKPGLRDKMADRCYKTAIKNCSWRSLTSNLIADMKKKRVLR